MEREKMYNEEKAKNEKLNQQLEKETTERENYKKALDEERSKRRTADAKLSSQETTSAEHISAVEKERDSYKKHVETLTSQVSEKDKAIEEATAKLTEFEQKALKHDEFVTKNLTDKLALIPEEKQEFVKKVLDGKSLVEQLDLVEWFVGEYKDFKSSPTDKWGNPNDTSEYEKAKEAWDLVKMAIYAPKTE